MRAQEKENEYKKVKGVKDLIPDDVLSLND